MKWVLLIVSLISVTSQSQAVNRCEFPGKPPGVVNYQLNGFASGLAAPTKLLEDPVHPGHFYALEQKGRVRAISNGRLDVTPALDITDEVVPQPDYDERGLLGIAFHPNFAQNARVFLNYNSFNPVKTRVSEFQVNSDGTFNRQSEKIIIEFSQTSYVNHKGGEIAFGNDGYLYLSVGDGGSQNDPNNNGQNKNTFFAKILRISVDGTSANTFRPDPMDANHVVNYTVPRDNPFVGVTGTRSEIFAYGLRNPWRFSFDRATGDLWVGDVGQDKYEEIDVVEKGKNYGWSIMEGFHCNKPSTDCNQQGLELPVYEYSHDDGNAVIGGFVYRGTKHRSLIGDYVFADYGTGNIWEIRRENGIVTEHQRIAQIPKMIVALAPDTNGEIYVMTADGQVLRLDELPSEFSANFPTTVSQTGCFLDNSTFSPASGVVPYSVNGSLWSDGLDKDRFIFVPPNGDKVAFQIGAPWSFPDSTVLIKNFYVPTPATPTHPRKIIETRFLIKRSNGFEGYTYRWDENEKEGTLLYGTETRDITLATGTGDTTVHFQYPTETCNRCHLGNALGVTAEQIHHDVVQQGVTIDQINWMKQVGILDAATVPSDLSSIHPVVNFYDESQPLEGRARSYLQVQCAHCHNPSVNGGQTNMDFRMSTPLSEMGICNVKPQDGSLGISGSRLLKPGSPDKSVVLLRLNNETPGIRMPPVATDVVDAKGVDVLRRWIGSLTSCED